jgi:outer membrane protein OmpA-like peptidoglycan-associated protein
MKVREPAVRRRRQPQQGEFQCALPSFWRASRSPDPAYTANAVADYFHKAKAAGLGKTRKICFDGDPDCAPAAAPKPFDLMVNFEFDSDRLTSSAKENLGQFAEALHDPQLKKEKFAVDGYTDATGKEVYNKSLSQRRAVAVVNFLTEHGVDRGSLLAKGFGPSNPRAPDPFDPINRRVETHLAD